MEPHQPSRTAQGAALHRAAHQLADSPPIFDDPLALTIVGPEAEAELRSGRGEAIGDSTTGLRLFVATRSRFTEDCLHEAVARGVRQYVLVGAGLDTFAYRNRDARLRVYEVDHPATQAWKRARLGEVDIAVPDDVAYAPVDFERETLREGLARAGFDFARPGFFAWLGVTPYLTRDAIMATLGDVARLPHDSEIVFDYATPPSRDTPGQSAQFDAMAARVAALGEPFRSLLDPDTLVRDVRALGFARVNDFDTAALNALYFRDRADGLALRGRGHLLRARV